MWPGTRIEWNSGFFPTTLTVILNKFEEFALYDRDGQNYGMAKNWILRKNENDKNRKLALYLSPPPPLKTTQNDIGLLKRFSSTAYPRDWPSPFVKQLRQKGFHIKWHVYTGDIIRRIPCEGEEVRQRRRVHPKFGLYFLRTKDSISGANAAGNVSWACHHKKDVIS